MDQETEELWDEFHRVVNMTSRELSEWLRTQSATMEQESLPDQAGSSLGRHVLEILGKRKTDMRSDDIAVMRQVVDLVHEERRCPFTAGHGLGFCGVISVST